ncbi:MAG TPA: glycosyltransferase [Blastocatellia bacterium]|nr:glycosyltransferase [Blastocatellia bacterium]
MEISAIICTHNRAHYLSKALQSLLDQTLPRSEYEIIVVDNCSGDSTRETVERFSSGEHLKYIYEPKLGLSYARNSGWRNASGNYVAYLDDDAIATPAWLERILEVFETVKPRPGCVGGRVYPLWEAARPKWLSDEIITSLAVIDWSDEPRVLADIAREWLVGANMAFPLKLLEEVGGFVTGLDRAGRNLLSGGDVLLQKQIVQRGFSCFYHPEIAVSHLVPASRLRKPWFVRRYYWQGISDAIMQMIQENPTRSERWQSAASKAAGLLRSPSYLAGLLLPTNDPERFTKKCFALIALGQIRGLLSRARK